MNENARMNRTLNDPDAPADEATLFADAADSQDELDEFLSDDASDSAVPQLTLRHPEEYDEAHPEDEDDADVVTAIQTSDVGEATANDDDEIDNWPWDIDLNEVKSQSTAVKEVDVEDAYDDMDFAELDRLTRPSTARSAPAPHALAEDDHSAIEDVVLSMPIVQTPIEETLSGFARKMDAEADALAVGSNAAEVAARAESSEPSIESATNETDADDASEVEASEVEASEVEASEVEASEVDESATDNLQKPVGSVRQMALPKRIGSGQLVPTRLTWRPGDPFGGTEGAGRRRFRWDVMLTSAGITAACGMACIWLLRTILA